MRINSVKSYAPEYPKKPSVGKKIAALTAAAVLAAGLSGCRPALSGNIQPDDSPICTESTETGPSVTSVIELPGDDTITDEPALEGDVIADPGGIDEGAPEEEPGVVGIVLPDPALTDGD